MRNIIHKLKTPLIALTIMMGLTLTTSSIAFASPFSGSTGAVCNGAAINGTGQCSGTTSQNSLNSILRTVLDILSFVVGFVAVLMIIISGFRIIVSGGDTNSFNSAKNGLLYAVIGIVIVAISQVIVQFVLTNSTK